MKPGSKSYIAFMRKIYFFSIAVGVLGLTGKFYLWSFPESYSKILNTLVIIALIWGTFFYCLFQILSLFEPEEEEYNWELVFPELALNDPSIITQEEFENMPDPRDRGKF